MLVLLFTEFFCCKKFKNTEFMFLSTFEKSLLTLAFVVITLVVSGGLYILGLRIYRKYHINLETREVDVNRVGSSRFVSV